MRISTLIFCFPFLLLSCAEVKKTKLNYHSGSATDFKIDFSIDSVTTGFIKDSIVIGSSAKVSTKKVSGKTALEIKTIHEFSDAFIDLEKLFGRTIDFSKSKYLTMNILVPKESWITALKFNFKDAEGNFGGCNEITNNFYRNHDKWLNVIVNMQEVIPDFKNWQGDESPLPKTKLLSFNPYNAHQADSSAIYIKSIALSDEFPTDIIFDKTLAPKPYLYNNSSHTLTFDEGEQFRYQIAYRAFESSFQALAKNINGNETRAIRLKGNGKNKHIAFLPILDKVTGSPVDFTKVKRLNFSYYLTEDSDDFDGATLFLANQHWANVLIEPKIFTDFKKGKWIDVSIDLKDFDFEKKAGSENVLPNVYEIRLGLNYIDNNKNIEMWLDNFGWE